MIYAIIGFIVVSFAAGFSAAVKIDRAQIRDLETAIEISNLNAASIMQQAKERVYIATNKAREANENLDLAHAQDINTINHYRDLLTSSRLRDKHKTSGCDTVSTGAGSGTAETGAEHITELSKELAGFLRFEAFRADKVAIYAKMCYQFVKNNCGIN